MAKTKKQSRKDSRGRVLRKGESERKDGTYMYRYMDECKNRKSVYAKTLSELREKASKIERDKLDNIKLSTNYTVDQLVRLNLEIHKNINKLAINTLTSDERTYNAHIKDSWLASKKIKDVKKKDILLFYAELSKTLKNSSIHTSVHKVLHQAFDLALEDQMIRFNPTKDVLKDFPSDVEEKVILSSQQLEELGKYMKDHPIYYKWHPLVVIFTETMIRAGELCGLTWNDVDLERKIIKIDHQIQRKNENGKSVLYTCPPKSKKGIRTIPLTDEAYQAFVTQKGIQCARGIHSNVSIDGYHDFVFVTNRGTPQQPTNLGIVLKRLTSDYNSNNDLQIPHLACHVLRHTGCTIMAKRMFRLGLNPKILQNWMGHSSLKMTLEYYNHVIEEESKNAMSEINVFNNNESSLLSMKNIEFLNRLNNLSSLSKCV